MISQHLHQVLLVSCLLCEPLDAARINWHDSLSEDKQDSPPLRIIHDFIPKEKGALQHFLDSWEFFSEADPTNGYVSYQSQEDAMNTTRPLVQMKDGVVLLLSEPGPEEHSLKLHNPPRAVRLESKLQLNSGSLLVGDFSHMPDHCGAWPAFWLLGEGAWPKNGEIDIIENVGGDLPFINEQTHVALHTERRCTAGRTGEKRLMSRGFFWHKECGYKWGQNADGCSVLRLDKHSFGKPFNRVGGGAYALLWTDSYIEVWFWKRPKIPEDVSSGKISVDTMVKWGYPFARYHLGEHCAADNFKNMSVIINTVFCGGFAGNQFKLMCGARGLANVGMANYSKAPNDVCIHYMNTEAGRRHVQNDAFWGIRSLRVFEYKAPTPKLFDTFHPTVNEASWCRDPTMPPWQVEDVKDGQCVVWTSSFKNKGHFGIGVVTHIEKPECANHEEANRQATPEELELWGLEEAARESSFAKTEDVGERQKEKGRRRKAKGERQKEKGKRRKAKGERQKEKGKRRKAKGERPGLTNGDASDAQGSLMEQSQSKRQKTCFHDSKAYGDWQAGACGAADTVGLFASDECLGAVASQNWWDQETFTNSTDGAGLMTPERCQELCQQTPYCSFFNFRKTTEEWCGSSCWLKKSLRCGKHGYARKRDAAWISGPRLCARSNTYRRCSVTYTIDSGNHEKKRYADNLMCFNSETSCPKGCEWSYGRCMRV